MVMIRNQECIKLLHPQNEMIKFPQSHSFPYQSTIMLQIMLGFLLFSSVSTAQEQYLINCGSSTSVTTNDNQHFVYEKSDGVRFSHHKSKADKNASLGSLSTDKPYYQTARVFKKPSSYDFKITTIGTYYVRLHFYAFKPSHENAKFNVSAVGHLLLPDFIPSRSHPISKEFLININHIGWFRIYFVPGASSIAFVNAIEVVNTLSNNTRNRGPYVTPAGSKGASELQEPKVLETIHRINVGGNNKEVKPSNASQWTAWDTDDRYLMTKGAAENKRPYPTDVNINSTLDDAPQEVYKTARFTKSNVTWEFKVNKESNYSVRVYFCDISLASGPNKFDLYVYRNYYQPIDTSDILIATAFYHDFMVGSDSLDHINISVGVTKNAVIPSHPFLNGLEILQVIETTIKEPNVDNQSPKLEIVISLVASAVVMIFVILGAVAVCLHQRRKQKRAAEAFEWGNLPLDGAASSHYRTSGSTSSQGTIFQNLQLGLKIPFGAIQRVTNNFDDNLIIGEGGFGKVYKGTLTSGLKVAVKRGSSDHGQGISEFQTEITILSKIRHRHLVSLLGYCCENGEMILVYEFMEKGTLRYHLYSSENRSNSSTKGMLSWKQRLEICIGAAKGIQYLHTGTNKGIIHRDVKSTNILLDENYVAKVSDFGLSRSGYLEQTHVSISDVKGTLGYLDPEYITCLQLTEKSDVYSFGVVLLEVLCARPVIDLSLPKEQVGLKEWAMTYYEEGQLESIIDPSIADEINQNSLMKFWEAAEGCLRKDAAERPPMSDVCWGLEYALQLQIVATERVLADDSTTDASLNMKLPAVRHFPSQSIADNKYNDELLYSNTGEVFSQLASNDGSAR